MEPADRRQYQEKIHLGQVVYDFLGSDVAGIVEAKAQETIEAAIDDFMYVDPTDAKAVFEIQRRILVAAAVPQWLTDVISDGDGARIEYESLDQIEKEAQRAQGEL